MKKKVMMRLADALGLPGCPVTREKYQKMVKQMGLETARAQRVEVEIEDRGA